MDRHQRFANDGISIIPRWLPIAFILWIYALTPAAAQHLGVGVAVQGGGDGAVLTDVVLIEGNEMFPVADAMEISFFSSVGGLAFVRGTQTIGEGSAGLFQIEGSRDIFLSATAHQVYDKGTGSFGALKDGNPDPGNMFFYSDVCKRIYSIKPGSLRIGTKNIDVKSRTQSTDLRASDWLIAKLAEPPCNKIRIPLAKAVRGEEFKKLNNLMVAGLYKREDGQIEKQYALCKPVQTEGTGAKKIAFHGCSTLKGGSGGSMIVVGDDGRPKIIGIHRGVSDESWSLGANEGVLFTPELLKEIAK